MTEIQPQDTPANGNAALLFPWADDPQVEALQRQDIWCALDARGLISVEGEDAEVFLQGQLTQDMARLRQGHALLAAHCTPKGRVTALFRAWHVGTQFLLDLPAEMQAPAQRRLGLYVLRSRVKIQDARGSYQRTAVAGAGALARLRAYGAAVPEAPGSVATQAGLHCLRLPGERCIVLAAEQHSPSLRAHLAGGLRENLAHWTWLRLLHGEAEILPATVEAFTPQMLNLDTLDGVSFRKGCYTGQEIVARTHYLGKVKRRMQAFRLSALASATPGQMLAVAATQTQGGSDDAALESGSAQLVWCAPWPAPGGGQIDTAQVNGTHDSGLPGTGLALAVCQVSDETPTGA